MGNKKMQLMDTDSQHQIHVAAWTCAWSSKYKILCGYLLVVEASGPDVIRPHQPSKVPQPPRIRFLGVHHRHLFVTDPQRLWDFLERIGAVTCPLDREWETESTKYSNIFTNMSNGNLIHY